MRTEGFSTLPVLCFVLGVSLLVLAEYGESRLFVCREESEREAVRSIDDAREALVRLETVAAREAQTGSFERRSGRPPAMLEYEITLAPLERQTLVVERDASTGRAHRIGRPALLLAEASSEELRAALESYRDQPGSGGSIPAGGVESLVEALLTHRDELRDADQLREFLQRFFDDEGVRGEGLIAGVDPISRLRRTNAHPSRREGFDRGRSSSSGPILIAGELAPRALLVRGEDTRGRSWSARQQSDLAQKVSLRFQDDWLRCQLDQPGGVEVGALLGPENLMDQDWEPGDSLFVPTPGWSPSHLAWYSVPGAALGFGASGAIRASKSGAEIVIEPMAPFQVGDARWEAASPGQVPGGPVTGAVSKPSGSAISPGSWGGATALAREPRSFLLGQFDVLYGRGRDLFHGWGDGRRRWARCESEINWLQTIGSRVVVAGNGGLLHLFDARGVELDRLGLAGEWGAPIWLPLLQKLAFPAAEHDRWVLVDEKLGRLLVLGQTPRTLGSEAVGRGALVAPDGRDGVFWVEHHDGETRVTHGRFTGDGLLVSAALRNAGDVTHLVAFPGRGFVVSWEAGGSYSVWRLGSLGPTLSGTGSATLEGGETIFSGQAFVDPETPGFWLPTELGLGWHALRPTEEKAIELGSHVVLGPREDRTPCVFRAPLVRGLEGAIREDDGSLTTLTARGTINRGGSVLRSGDLSDLFVDGVYSSPRRRETVRYSTIEAGVGGRRLNSETGWGSLLVKPERTASESTEPERPRTLVRTVQQFSLRFAPDLDWIVAHHPEVSSSAMIHSYQVSGSPRRLGRATSTITRRPDSGDWIHTREVEVLGEPWAVHVLVGDPPSSIGAVTVDQLYPDGTLASSSSLPDEAESGEWMRLAWGWRRGGEAWLRVGVAESWGNVAQDGVGQSAWGGDAFELIDEEWTIELGGELDTKSFRGTFQQLRMGKGGDVGERDQIFGEPSPSPPSFRWVLPFSLAPSGQWLRIAALGEFSGGTGLRWALDEWTATGRRTFTAHGQEFSSLPSPPSGQARYVLSGWLTSNSSAGRTPLLEAIEVEWVPGAQLPRVVDVSVAGVGPSSGRRP